MLVALLALSPPPSLLASRAPPLPSRHRVITSVQTSPSPSPLASRLGSLQLLRASDSTSVELADVVGGGAWGSTLVVFGTYAADFNQIEYAQKLRHYLPQLSAKGVGRTLLIVNGEEKQCLQLARTLDLPAEIELLSDPSGEAGRRFGVSRGWLPEEELSPYLKLWGMLFGLGAGGTLPSVIAGYIGNPWGTNGWIENALAQGQRAGRWPGNALELDESGGVACNKFDDLPLVGGWGRRPLELATLRLQNMVGISIANWNDLQPADLRCLTQLGGCAVISPSGEMLFEFSDHGICGTANFEKILEIL